MNLNMEKLTKLRLLNILHSVLLAGGMTLILGLMGWIFLGWTGVLLSGIFCAVGLPASKSLSPRLVLKLYRARRLSDWHYPRLFSIIETLSRRAGLPHTPGLYYIPSQIQNAFAIGTGRQAAIGVTDGILRHLSNRELTGILAHEVSHIKNKDTTVMGLADMVSRFTSFLSTAGLFLFFFNLPLMLMGYYTIPWVLLLLLYLAPLGSMLLQVALSRSREYHADLQAVSLSGDPEGYASALRKLERMQQGLLARLFWPGRRAPEPSLLRTHPPTEERIRRILELRKHGGADRSAMPSGQLELAAPSGVVYPVIRVRTPRWHVSGLWY